MGFISSLLTGRITETFTGIPLEYLFSNPKERKCNFLQACVSALGPEYRSKYEFFLVPLMGSFWFACYFLFSFFGVKNRKSYMLYFPQAYNLSWEFILIFIFNKQTGMRWVFRIFMFVAFLMNATMGVCSIIFGGKQHPRRVREGGILVKVVYHFLVYLTMVLFVVTTSIQFSDYVGVGIGIVGNAGMSINFLIWYLNLEDPVEAIDWVDALGAVCRSLGTFFGDLQMFMIYDSSEDTWFWGEKNCFLFFTIFFLTICDFSYSSLCCYSVLRKLKKEEVLEEGEEERVE